MVKKETYDRAVVGERLKRRRKHMGLTRSEIAEQIGIVEKYYADIERGTCGMSVETLMALAKLFGLSLDEMIYGEEICRSEMCQEEVMSQFEQLSPKARKYCTEMMALFIKGMKEIAD